MEIKIWRKGIYLKKIFFFVICSTNEKGNLNIKCEIKFFVYYFLRGFNIESSPNTHIINTYGYIIHYYYYTF